ncbi:MAG: FG-GAP repeat protein [Deltaproteobacteria bacterium]|nr:FG-GAP repeat protein [Deltaproteobacteria bacterium]
MAFDDGQHVWQTGDLDGDGRPDLLWSADPNARKIWGQAAAPHWKIFFNR